MPLAARPSRRAGARRARPPGCGAHVRDTACERTLGAEVLLVLVVEGEVLELLDQDEVLLDLLHHHVGIALAEQELQEDQAFERVVFVRAVLDALPNERHDGRELDAARRGAARSTDAREAQARAARLATRAIGALRRAAAHVKVPLAISRISAGLGGIVSLHVHSRTICSISV